MKNKILTLAISLGLAGSAFAQVQINEVFINPPGTDNGLEFFELFSSAPSTSLNGLSLVVLEGDGASAGTIDVVLSLTGLSTGANGLFLWRDAATVLNPPPHPATVVNVADFNPDLENGSETFLLVSGFSGALATDLDADDNGILDSTPWTSVLDAIGIRENDTGINIGYGASLGFADFPAFSNTNNAFTPDAIYRLGNGGSWYASDTVGTAPGPFSWDVRGGDTSGVNQGQSGNLTPGSANMPVPEPSALAFVGLGFGLIFARRRFAR